MNESQFVWWLHGFVELHGEPPTAQQWEIVKEHLALVFTKVTTKSITTTDFIKIWQEAAPGQPVSFQTEGGRLGDGF